MFVKISLCGRSELAIIHRIGYSMTIATASTAICLATAATTRSAARVRLPFMPVPEPEPGAAADGAPLFIVSVVIVHPEP